MKGLIVYAHPWEGSFNHGILETVLKGLSDSGHETDVIDLIKDGFNPVTSREELALYHKGGSLDPLVKNYQDRISQTDYLFLIFPNWWGGMPAVLKGFFDKVFLKGFAYKEEPAPGNGLLKINKAAIITTFDAPAIVYHFLFKQHIKKNIAFQILKTNGVKSIRIFPLFRIKDISGEKRMSFLAKVERFCCSL